MRRIISCLVLFSFVLNNSLLVVSPAYAKKAGSTSLSIKTSDGSNTVLGSILSPRSNRLKIKLTKDLANAIRSEGIDSAEITITKIADENDTSNIYSISSDDVDLIGKNLVFDVVPCTDASGATVTAGALPSGTYTLTITVGNVTASGSFSFEPPAVVVGTVDPGSSGSCTGGTNSVNSVSGSQLGQLVALSSNCTYFNEVRASRKIGKKGKKGKNRLAYQEDGTSTSSGDATEPEPFYEDPVVGETNVAVSENTVTVTDEETGDTEIEEISAPVTLDPENENGNSTPVDENTDAAYEQALDLVVGDQNDDGVTDEEDLQEVADDPEVLEQLEEALADSAVSEEVTDDGTTGDVNGTPFQPADDCGSKIMAIVGTVDLMSLTDDDLKSIGGKLIPEIQSGSLVNCVPPFVKDFIPNLFNSICGDSNTQCDNGLITFAKKFLFNLGRNENRPPEDPKQICQDLENRLAKASSCMGDGCPPLPCFTGDFRDKLASEKSCEAVLKLLPTDCQLPPPVCNLQPRGPQGPSGGTSGQTPPPPPDGGTSGQTPPPPPDGGTSGQTPPPPAGGTSGQTPPLPAGGTSGQLVAQISPGAGPLGNTGGQPPQGGDQCMDAGRPQEASICKPCNTAGPEGCFGPEQRTVTASDGVTTCILPQVQCIPFTSLGATSPDAMFDGICLFGDGDLTVGEEDDKPKDPKTCKPFPFDPKLGCPQLRPTCNFGDDLSKFDKACCQLPPPPGQQGQPGQPPAGGTSTTSGQPGNTSGQLAPNQIDGGLGVRPNECILRKLCSDPSNFGADGKPDSTKVDAIVSACKQGQPGGMGGQPPQGNSQCIEQCKSQCGTDQTCLQSCGKNCQPTGGTSGQPPCDPLKDPNCKPPTGGTSGQPPCDPATDPNCKPPTGGTSGQPPCDPSTGSCPPPPTGDCPQGQVKDPATGQCKPADGGTQQPVQCPSGQTLCSDGKTCKSNTAECPPPPTGGDCPQGQVKDPATGQCKPADGGTQQPVQCPSGQTLCSDGKTCKSNTAECPQGGTQQPVQCPSGQTLCSDGKTCKSNTAECPQQGGTQPPPTTCPSGTVKCSDGSCKATCS